jgi:small GTP-binding protein
MAEKANYAFKIALVGDSGVGKTSIIKRYEYPDEKIIKTDTTIGLDITLRQYDNIGGDTVKLMIYDTAGQERFKSLMPSYFRGCAGIVLVYDVTNINSFRSLSYWLDEIQKNCNPGVFILLVGNKCDILHRIINMNYAHDYASEHGLVYLESSAKDNIGVTRIFTMMVNFIYNKITRPMCISDENGVYSYEKNKDKNKVIKIKEIPKSRSCCPIFD